MAKVPLLGAVVALIVIAGFAGKAKTKVFNPLVFIQSYHGHTYSLSKFQILLWTLVVGFLTIYVWLVTHELLVLSEEIIWLLGIVGTSSVSSRVLAMRDRNGGNAPTPTSGSPQLTDLFMRQGEVSLQKLQMFFWTLIVAVVIIFSTVKTLTIPTIGRNLLALMGISHGT